MTAVQRGRPNKRLKLAGLALRGSVRLCARRYRRAGRLRPLALAPQLKRDPLGGALPPRKHHSVNSFGIVMRGAPRAETHGRAPARRAPPLQGRHVSGAAAHVLRYRSCPEAASQGELAQPSVRCAARSSIGE